MTRRLRSTIFLYLLLPFVLAAACRVATLVDRDGGRTDGAAPRDAAVGPDAAAGADAAMTPDAEVTPDAAVGPDAAMTPDAEVMPDAIVYPDSGTDPVAQICARWNTDRASLSEGTWSGSVASCTAGDISATGRANALRLVNLYRFLAGLGSVTTDPTRNQLTQECALMMHANGQLTHSPPTSWTCYTSDGAQAAGSSNIAMAPGVSAVDLYMVDPGNPSTIGHRRWILSNGLGAIGLGSTSSFSCMWVISTGGSGGRPWTAWPPPGPVPHAVWTASWDSPDATGWTVQSDSISLSSAAVTVTAGGLDRPVTVTSLASGYGSTYAIRFNPDGWTTQAGTTYSVSITGISTPIQYDVQVVSCP